MSKTMFLRGLPLAVLLSAGLAGMPAQAQESNLSWFAGYSTFKLRPATGRDQILNGVALGGAYRLSPAWSAEMTLSRQTGTSDNAIDLRQIGALVGPRYTLALDARWQAFAHVRVGWEQLHARSGSDSDQKATFAFAPGLGIEFAINRAFSLRAQADLVRSHYAGVSQASPAVLLGFSFRPQ